MPSTPRVPQSVCLSVSPPASMLCEDRDFGLLVWAQSRFPKNTSWRRETERGVGGGSREREYACVQAVKDAAQGEFGPIAQASADLAPPACHGATTTAPLRPLQALWKIRRAGGMFTPHPTVFLQHPAVWLMWYPVRYRGLLGHRVPF